MSKDWDEKDFKLKADYNNRKGLRIYLAGKYGDYENMYKRMKLLNKLGFGISHDWTYFVRNGIDTISLEMRQLQCKLDLGGVYDAHWVVLFIDDKEYPYNGTMNELTCACACKKCGQNKRVFVVCPFGYRESKITSRLFFQNDQIDKIFKSWDTFINFAIGQIADHATIPCSVETLNYLLKSNIKLYRSYETETEYLKYLAKLFQNEIDINDYMMNKLNFTGKSQSTYELLENNFPYYLEPGMKHYVLWLNPSLNEEEQETIIDQIPVFEFGQDKFAIKENTIENKSVKKIPHVHIFVY